MTPYYNRQPTVLPPPDTLPFPGNLVRQCSDCPLAKSCTAPVPGEGATPAEVMFVGEAPGRNEDEQGRPFIGQAGQYLESILFSISVPRENVFISNIIHCRPPGNRDPKPAEIKACAKWLNLELDIVQPRIVVALGAFAISHFLGAGAGTVEHLHGRPVEVDGRIILPAYHPAAALRNTNLIRMCQEDFQVLRGLIRGDSPSDYHVHDEYPDPDYKIAEGADGLQMVKSLAETAGYYAIDTETCAGKLWSMQVSTRPGTAWFIPLPENHQGRVDLTDWDATAIIHNYLFDIQYINVRDDRFLDSMVLAYLVGQPQGLKELANRLCGIQMKTYREVVAGGQLELSLDYLNKVSKKEWPDPPEVEETKWDNKKGRIVTRIKHPWHISRKVAKILGDLESSPETDPFGRWRQIPEVERAVVEGVLGPMPESSLKDIPLDEAVQYAAKDADADLRVYLKLRKMIDDLDLNFVLRMDTDILPMVHTMMQNGMAVDLEHVRNLSEDYDARMRAKATELASIVGHPFNPSSSQQVAAVVYDELGFKPTKRTETGLISTDDQELKKINHPVIKGILQYRGLNKNKGTYADNLLHNNTLDATGVPRMHTTLTTTRTETGRLSSKKSDDGEGMALQNIPTRNKEAKAIKNAFVAPEGWLLGEGDLGQIELCTQAHIARCKGLIDLFNAGRDPHTESAARLFGVPLDVAAQTKYRYPVKRAAYGVIYLLGAEGLSAQIAEYIADLEMDDEPVDVEPWDVPTCERFIEDYYNLYPEIRDYQMEQLAHARRYGYVRDPISGRIRYIPEVTCPVKSVQEAGARMAANMPVTSSAQTIIKLAMGELWRELPKTEWSATKILLQVHDSLVFELPDVDEFVRGCLGYVRSVMCNSVKLLVPVKADFKVGKQWGSLEKLDLTK